MVVDDGSHINHHQIATLEALLDHVTPGGFYVIEDIHSSCSSWASNLVTQSGEGTDGTPNCLSTGAGTPTIFRKLIDMEMILVKGHYNDSKVMHISIYAEAAVLQKK